MQGQTHLVLGATGGIGAALVRRLAAAGATVVAIGRDAGRLADLASATGCATTVVADASDAAAVEAAVEGAAASRGRIDGVANCVGSLLLKPAHATSPEEFDAAVRTNLASAFNVVRAAAGVMQKQEAGGSIVLCSSAAARIGLANHEAIAAAKAGIIGLALSAAATYAPKRVRVNVVAPGLVRTPMTERIWGNEAALTASVAMHPLGRIGEPDEVAAALAFLLDASNAWITGQVLGVDGGLGTVKPR